MKMSKTLQNDELPHDTLMTVEDIKTSLVNALVEEFDNQLRKDGEYLDDLNKTRLSNALLSRANVQLTMNVSVKSEMLDDWGVYPSDRRQSALQSWEVEQ